MFKTNVTLVITSCESVGPTQAVDLARHLDEVKDMLGSAGLLIATGKKDQHDLYYGDFVYESAHDIADSVSRYANGTISRAFLLVSDSHALASVELLVSDWIANSGWKQWGRSAGPFLFEVGSTSWFTLLPQMVEPPPQGLETNSLHKILSVPMSGD